MSEPRLTHVDEHGAARMVDVADKQVTVRTATAAGRVVVAAHVPALLREGGLPKGDALAVARIAGIAAAKRTPDLVPLCHPIAIHGVVVDLEVTDDAVEITATVRTADRTGVEMEALTSVAVAGLALIDMVKAVDRTAVLTDVRVLAKSGGRSGDLAPAGGRSGRSERSVRAPRTPSSMIEPRARSRLDSGLLPARTRTPGSRPRSSGATLTPRRGRH